MKITEQLKDKKIQNVIKTHEQCIKLFEAIEGLKWRKKRRQEDLDGFAGTFPELKRSLINNIDTLDRCIYRISKKYTETLTKLNENESNSKI